MTRADLDPSNRLATIHQRHGQADRQDSGPIASPNMSMYGCVESARAEMTSRREACALSAAAAGLDHVTLAPCDVNVTSSGDSDELRIPFVACNSAPFSVGRPSLTGRQRAPGSLHAVA